MKNVTPAYVSFVLKLTSNVNKFFSLETAGFYTHKIVV